MAGAPSSPGGHSRIDTVSGRVERALERVDVRLNRLVAKERRRRIAYWFVVVAGIVGFATHTWWLLEAGWIISVVLIGAQLDEMRDP
jgi:hypothetical protein